MSKYKNLIDTIISNIYDNGVQYITGLLLQDVLLSMINSLGHNYQYVGVATPETNPGSPDQNVFYLATTPGTYVNFAGTVINDSDFAKILKWNGQWVVENTNIPIGDKLSKEYDDVANGIITFLKGLKIGKYLKGQSGGYIDLDGASELLSLVIREGIQSLNFSTGALGSGFCIKKDENGNYYIEADSMLIRKEARFNKLAIQELKHVGGQIILTSASLTCARVEELEDAYRCYFQNNNGEKTIKQEFVVGDFARAQTFNIKEGTSENIKNTYYWRAVVGVGDNYIDLSKTDCDVNSGIPEANDEIVQLGNKTEVERQSALIFSAYGEGAPYFKMYRGINSYSLEGKEFVTISRTLVDIIADHIKFSSGENLKDVISDLESKVDKAVSDLASTLEYVNTLSKDLESVKNQVDGAIESYFEKTDPTTSNYPAISWTTEELKQAHANDTYTNISTGKSWKWVKNGSTWEWSPITDTAAEKALALAGQAKDTADGKRRVFVVTPTNASTYDVGDLWVNATYGKYSNDLLRCKVAKEANAAWSIDHWELASKYTDDTVANQAIKDAANAKAAADNAQQDATDAKERLDDWASDNTISPTEKPALKDEIARIDADKTQISNGYNKYGLGLPTAFDNAYTSYRTVLVSLTATEPESISIPSDFSTKQTTYYSERTKALTAISDAAKDYAEDLVGNIKVGGRNLLIGTNKGAYNWATTIGGGTTNLSSSIQRNVNSLKIEVIQVSPSYHVLVYLISDDMIKNFKKGSNCVLSFDLYTNTELTLSTSIRFSDSTNLIANFPSQTIGANEWKKVVLLGKFGGEENYYTNKQRIYLAGLNKPGLVAYIQNLKLEEGNVATDWTPAPEDTSAAIQEALETAQDAQTAANNADEKASQATSRLDEWASDSVISPTEKLSLKQEQKMITAEKDSIVADAAKYGVSSTAYVNAFNAYNAELTYHTTATPENITIRSSFATNQASYYTAYKNINSAIADAAKKFANDIAVDLDSYKKTVTAKFEQTNNSITAAVTTSKEYTNTVVSNIQVGGVNLLKGTKDLSQGGFQGDKTSNGYEGFTVIHNKYTAGNPSIDVASYTNLLTPKPNTTYTLSFYCKGNGFFGSYFYPSCVASGENIDGNTTTNVDGYITTNLTSDWRRVWIKWKTRSSITEAQSLLPIRLLSVTSEIWACGFKFEEGNIATDWTQAPEDIKSSIDSVNTALTTYKQETTAKLTVLEQKIALTVTSEELQQTRTEILNSAATTAQSKADAAKQAAISTAAQDATNKVNAIQIGGRNLAIGSSNGKGWTGGTFKSDDYSFYKTSNSTGESYIYSQYFTLEKGRDITISFEAKQDNADYLRRTCDLFILPDRYQTEGIVINGKTYAHTTEWTRYTFTAKVPSTIVSPVRIRFDHNGVDDTSHYATIYVRKVKVEYGNKATDWSLAPEDVTSDIEKAKQEAIADAAGKYVTTTIYEQRVSSIEADLEGVSLMASKTETKVTEIDGEITSLENRVSEAEIAVQPDNIAAIVTSTVKVGGVNLLLNSYYSRSLTNTSQKDTYAYYDDLSVYLEKDKTYVLSSKTNGKWTSDHGVFGKNNVIIWITKGISGTYNRIISSDSMKSDGSYGSVFTHTGETGEYVLRFNIYDAGTFWFKETKIENGTISTAYSKAPQDQYTDNSYLSRGKMLYRDPTFSEGYNSITLYNAKNGLLERVNNVTGNPNTSGYCLKITSKGKIAYWSGWGGFGFGTSTKANRILLTKIVAKIPVGRTLGWATNATGDNSRSEWLTSNKGTGEWSEYIFRLICGSTGSFSTTNYFYLSGGTEPTEASPLVWYVSFATVYDVTGVDDTPTKDEIKTGITIAPNVINVFGKAINLTGAVTFSSLANDAQDKINTAQNTANTANTAANNAQNTASNAVSAVTASKDTIAKELGYSSFADMQAKPTIIDGGYIRTSYLESDAIRATIVTAEKISSLNITTGNITITNGARIGDLIVKDNTLYVDDEEKTAINIGGSTATKKVVLGGQTVGVGITIKPTTKSLTGLKIYCEGQSSVALDIWGQNNNIAMKAFGGCDWTIRDSSKWIMPGLLWCARMSNGGTVYDQFGDACGTVTTRRTGVGKYLIQHNLGHGEYVPVVIADQGSTGNLFANVEDVQYDHFYVRIIHKDQSYKDASFYVAILGRTKNP